MGTGIEMLAVGNCVLRKDEQNPALKQDDKDASSSIEMQMEMVRN